MVMFRMVFMRKSKRLRHLCTHSGASGDDLGPVAICACTCIFGLDWVVRRGKSTGLIPLIYAAASNGRLKTKHIPHWEGMARGLASQQDSRTRIE